METSSLSTSSPDSNDEEVKACCASFYENDLVRALLGDSFHPGGLKLTRRLGETLHLSGDDVVLDIACGQGTSACLLARTFGCRVIGVDLSEANLHRAQHRAEEEGVGELIEFRVGDAEQLPGGDSEFSVVISECALCLFPDKPIAAREMFRVLRYGGRLGMTDMDVDPSRLPEDMRGMLAHAACLAGALPVAEYRRMLTSAGFGQYFIENHPEALIAMLGDIAKRILVAQIAEGLGKVDLSGLDLPWALRLIKRCRRLVEEGVGQLRFDRSTEGINPAEQDPAVFPISSISSGSFFSSFFLLISLTLCSIGTISSGRDLPIENHETWFARKGRG